METSGWNVLPARVVQFPRPIQHYALLEIPEIFLTQPFVLIDNPGAIYPT